MREECRVHYLLADRTLQSMPPCCWSAEAAAATLINLLFLKLTKAVWRADILC